MSMMSNTLITCTINHL